MTPDEIKAVNDDAVAEIVVEISERHHPRLHLGTPCPTWGCCECGAEGGCEAGLLLKILHDGQTDLAAAVAERDRLRAALMTLTSAAEVAVSGALGDFMKLDAAAIDARTALGGSTAATAHVVEYSPSESGSWAVCSCGWRLNVRGSVFEAQHAADAHISGSTVGDDHGGR